MVVLQIVTAITAVASVIIAIAVLFQNRRHHEMLFRPYLLVSLPSTEDPSNIETRFSDAEIIITTPTRIFVENIGSGPALRVYTESDDIQDFRDSPSTYPGLRAGSRVEIELELTADDLDHRPTVVVRYDDVFGNRYDSTFLLRWVRYPSVDKGFAVVDLMHEHRVSHPIVARCKPS